MDITELKNEGLTRELRVVVPAAELAEKADSKLVELQKDIQLPGFRKGRVPLNHLRRLYGRQVKAEVVEEVLRKAVEQVPGQRGERAAYEPEVELEGGEEAARKVIEEDADLVFTMIYEVMPEVKTPEDFSDLEVTRYRVKIADEQVDEAVKNIAAQLRDYEERPEDAPAEKGDRLTISFVGRIDGEEFEGGTAEHMPVVLGSGQFIPGFEDQLIGARAGEERTVKVTFPPDYGVEKLAGREAEFSVTVEKVEAPGEQKIDDELARKLGLESLDALREKVREQLAAEYQQAADAHLKQEVLDALDERFDFPVPQRLVDAEYEHIWRTATEQLRREGKTFEDEGMTEEEARKEYREIAERRVRLGLVIGAIGAKAGVDVTQEELQQALIARAQQYPGQEKQVIEFYRKTPEALIELRAPIFEAKVIDHILSSAKVIDKETTPEELREMLEEEEKAEEGAGATGETGEKEPAERESAAGEPSASGSSSE